MLDLLAFDIVVAFVAFDLVVAFVAFDIVVVVIVVVVPLSSGNSEDSRGKQFHFLSKNYFFNFFGSDKWSGCNLL